jgi:hypothetical protein
LKSQQFRRRFPQLGSGNPASRRSDPEAEQHRAQVETLELEVAALNADAELQMNLVELRRAVAGEIESADGITALRAALTSMFLKVVLYREGDEVYLVPYLRAEAATVVWDLEDEMWTDGPPRRAPLHFQGIPEDARSESDSTTWSRSCARSSGTRASPPSPAGT